MSEKEVANVEQDPALAACKKVLYAAIWLIRNGYGKMMILPYTSESGIYWRCEFHPPRRQSRPFFRYSSGSEQKILESHCGGSVAENIRPEQLAQAIMVSVPDDAKSDCAGEASYDLLDWLEELEQKLDAGYLPQAFNTYTTDYSRWELIGLDNQQSSSIRPQPGFVSPGTEENCLKDEFWHDSEDDWNCISNGPAIYIQTAALNDDDFCYDLAGRARSAFSDADNFDAVRILRATVGAIHRYSSPIKASIDIPALLPISLNKPSDPAIKRAGRLLSMVHELHKAGYQRLRICSGLSADGLEWRCHVGPAQNVMCDGWTPIDMSLWRGYASSDGKAFFGWEDVDNDDARILATKFLERFPTMARAGAGVDWLYAGWFSSVLGSAENGILPAFYGGLDFTDCEKRISLPPPIFGVRRDEISNPEIYKEFVSNGNLKASMLPPPDADYEQLWPFCLTYDGYRGNLRTIADCFHIAETTLREGLEKVTMDKLRTTAFIYQRKIKDNSGLQQDPNSMRIIRNVVEEIRRRLEK
ncbi:MAG: hypothetical protein V4447_07065 [Pseudomonadota bacterium]